MSQSSKSRPAVARRSPPAGSGATPSDDQFVSHLAVILGGLAAGETRIRGLPEYDDVTCTVAAMRALGATVAKSGEEWVIRGTGNGSLLEADAPFDFRKSGTGARLLMGLVSTYDMKSAFTGDTSLSQQPMGDALAPLRLMGTQVLSAAAGDHLPLTLHGPRVAVPITYRLPTTSVEVKSAVLLAGLNTPGMTTVIESFPTSDHAERLLRDFAAAIEVEALSGGERRVSLQGQGRLMGCTVEVPGAS